MSTIRQLARDAIIEAFNDGRDPDIPAATKRRWVPHESSACPAVSIFFLEETVTPVGGRHGGLNNRALQVAVQCVAASSRPDVSDDLVEPMLAHATKRLGGSNLGGLALDLQEVSTRWETAQADRHYIAATQIWAVNLQTVRNDPQRKQ